MTVINKSVQVVWAGARDTLRRHSLLLVLFAALQLGDIVSTHLALRVGLPEGNPIPATVLTMAGEGGMYALKLLAVVSFLIVVCWLERRFKANPWRAVGAMNVIMLGVVVSNSAHLL